MEYNFEEQWGCWIRPDGSVVEVGFQGHRDWAIEHKNEIGVSGVDDWHVTDELEQLGWLSVGYYHSEVVVNGQHPIRTEGVVSTLLDIMRRIFSRSVESRAHTPYGGPYTRPWEVFESLNEGPPNPTKLVVPTRVNSGF